MKLPIKNLEKLIEVQDVRYAINGMYFDKEREAIAITNGHYLTMLKVTDCEDDVESAIIPRAIVERASKNGLEIKIHKIIEDSNENNKVPRLVAQAAGLQLDCIDAQFPNYDKFLGDAKYSNVKNFAKEKLVRVAYDYRYLKLLGDVLSSKENGSRTMEFEFLPNEKGNAVAATSIDVSTPDLSGEIVLMPIRIKED